MTLDRLVFRVRDEGHAHPSFEVVATGRDDHFAMTCGCLASQHGALLCPHIVAVLRENEDLVMYGKGHFAELRIRSAGSAIIDPENGYWQFYPKA